MQPATRSVESPAMLHIVPREIVLIEMLFKEPDESAIDLFGRRQFCPIFAGKSSSDSPSSRVEATNTHPAADSGVAHGIYAVDLSPARLDGRMNRVNGGGLVKGFISAPSILDQHARRQMCIGLPQSFFDRSIPGSEGSIFTQH